MSMASEVLKGITEEQNQLAPVKAKRTRARKFKVKSKQPELRMPDLTPEDVREALLDWIRKHPERLDRE